MSRTSGILLLLLVACARDDGPAETDADTDPPDTDAACDPTIPTVAIPDFHAEVAIAHAEIEPQALDPASDAYPVSKHQLYLPTDASITRRPELFVILPGTSNHAQGFEKLARLAAHEGYAVVSLAYDSEFNHAQYCADLTDADELIACRTAVIHEKVYGTDETDRVAIDDADSIVGRLERLLEHVATEYPSAGAEQYLSGGEIVWENLVVAGFSQGAVMTGYLSKDHALARAVLLAGGCDAFTDGEGSVHLSTWCTEARATPAERTFALRHVDDEPEEDHAIHEAYGLFAFGDYVNAPTESPSYCGGTHLLETDLPSAGGGVKYHLSVAHDEYLPVDAEGVPVLAEDYHWLFAVP